MPKKFWFEDIDRFKDLLPCPSCLQPVNIQNWGSLDAPMCHGYRCMNERCMAYTEQIPIWSYHSEFKSILQRVEDGYTYPKKVIAMAKKMV